MRILRVFPGRTSYTPDDELVAIGEPGLFRAKADEVHISVAFRWDCDEALRLSDSWSDYYPIVKIGGPAYGCVNGFIAGRYVKDGVTFTTRGCDFKCPWCLVPESEGKFRELNKVVVGHHLQDNNLLLANRTHLNKVFAMLKTQSQIQLMSIDCRLLKDWHIEVFRGLRLKEIWMALDTKHRMRAFAKACEKLIRKGFTRNHIRCFVLAGFNETIQASEDRLRFAYDCGALPFIQPYQDSIPMRPKFSKEDQAFIRQWSRPAIIKSMMVKKPTTPPIRRKG